MKITSSALLFLLLLPTQNTQTGMIDGVVLDSLTNLPVPGVNVSIRNTADPEKHCISLPCPHPMPSATTDSSGRFSISALRLASYRLTAWADGYVDADLGSNVTTNLGAPISLDIAQEA